MPSTGKYVVLPNGFACFVPNTVIPADGFYISYNNVDISIYGSDTTAIVADNETHYYVLNGDHRVAYSALIPNGLAACLEYFAKNAQLINKHSNRLPELLKEGN